MKKYLLMALAMTVLSITSCSDETVNPEQGVKYQAFNDDMRVLWSDHAQWTRNVIVNIIDGLPGTNEAVARLLQNQQDIGDAIKPYYGDAGGEALSALLTDHITIAADLLTAAKEGNTDAYQTANAAWYVNADEIATFLSTANPDHFPLAHMKTMMKSHLDHTLEEAVARLNSDYTADIIAYDKVYAELMSMADMLSKGILDQFPDKF